MLDISNAAMAFARTRWLQMRLRTQADVRRYQQRRIARLTYDLERTIPFYRDLSIKGYDRWPVIDKTTLLENFDRFNRAGLTLDDVRVMLARGGGRSEHHAVGSSTGTSGNRGYYVISQAERFVWLGTLLAKALPDALWRRHRVALALPDLSNLYRSASNASRITLGFFDVGLGVDAWADDLSRFSADTIVAPPKVLRLLAERGMLTASTIFSTAEVLDPIDREVIEAATGQMVREIYMATEGLLGVSCPAGTLHLAEDVVHFEWKTAAPGSSLRIPIITDFTRRVQAMARYSLNDLIELDDRRCVCGSPLQAVRRIEGRRDDVFLLPGAGGGRRMVTPDVLRNAVVGADPRILDFRIVQTGADAIEISLAAELAPECGRSAMVAIEILARRLDLAPISLRLRAGLDVPFDRKLRRVIRNWHPD